METMPISATPMTATQRAPAEEAVERARVGQRAGEAGRAPSGAERDGRRGGRGGGGRACARRGAARPRRGGDGARRAAPATRAALAAARRRWRGCARVGAPSSLRAARSRADGARGLAATSPGAGDDAAAVSSSASRLAAADADRQVGRADARRARVGQEALHAPVFQRVEGNPCKSPVDARGRPGEGQRAVELAELVVDGDADRLERALGRMAAARSAPARGSRR